MRFHCRNVQDLHRVRRLLHVRCGGGRDSGRLREVQVRLRHAPDENGLALVVRVCYPARIATSRQESNKQRVLWLVQRGRTAWQTNR